MPLNSITVLADSHKGGSTIQEWSSVIGIVTAIVGNILISFALNIQRYAHIRLRQEKDELRSRLVARKQNGNQSSAANGGDGRDEDEESLRYEEDDADSISQSIGSLRSIGSSSTARKEEKEYHDAYRKSYLQSPYWWLGICLMTVGEAGNFLAYGFAPASIVSPLGVVALISNCLIAPIMLKERFRQRDFWGVMIAVAGAVIVVLSASSSESKFGPHDIWSAISRWEFELYLGITALFILILMWASSKDYGKQTILIDLGLVGLYGGYTVLATKGISSLLSYTFWRILTYPVTYLLLAILIGTAALQIRYLNKALQRFDSTQVIPTQFVLFTLSVIIGSAILYRDFKSADAVQVGEFVAGCALTFTGVYFITSGRRQHDTDTNVGREHGEDEEAALSFIDEEEADGKSFSRKGSTRSKASDISAPLSLRRTISNHAESSAPPRTPRRYPSDPTDAPSIIISSKDVGEPRRHSPTESSPLLDNPWKSSTPSHTRPSLQPAFSTPSPFTTSSPALDRSGLPKTPDQLAQVPVTPDRRSTLNRSSISRILPGPLFSPLSSSLSGVVADSLRRGLDITPIPRRGESSLRESRTRNLLPGLRKTKSLRIGSDNSQAHTDISAPSPSRPTQSSRNTLDAPMQPSSHRRRSLSAAFSGFFGLKDANRSSDNSE